MTILILVLCRFRKAPKKPGIYFVFRLSSVLMFVISSCPLFITAHLNENLEKRKRVNALGFSYLLRSKFFVCNFKFAGFSSRAV